MSTPKASARPGGAGVRTPTTGGRRQQGDAPPSSAGAATDAFRTPTTAGGAGARRTPGTAGGGHPSAARTPHARAARLAVDTRRTAMFTPGGRQSRRKSGRMLRDSPRDLLRNLSRRLAPTSQAISSSSSSPGSGGRSRRQGGKDVDIDMDMDRDTILGKRVTGSASSRKQRSYWDIGDNDDDDLLPLDRPRMSLPIDDDDNDDDLRPHRSTILENDEGESGDADADFANFTMRSIELARRTATQEQLLQARRFSRGSLGRSSFGSMRMSDYIDGFREGDGDGDENDNIDLDLQLGEDAQSAFFPEGAFDNLLPPNEASVGGGADTTFERLDSETGGDSLDIQAQRGGLLAGGRESEFGVIDVPPDGNETSFMMPQQPQSDQTTPHRTPGQDLSNGHGAASATSSPLFVDTYDFGEDNNGDANNVNIWEEEPGGEVDEESAADDVAVTADDAAAAAAARAIRSNNEKDKGPLAKRLKLSAHGISYPSLPQDVIKRIAETLAQSSGAGRGKLGKDTVAALSTASDWFFEQVGVDLQRYASHAGRKTIDESDMLLLMKRQRQVTGTVTPFSLAQRFLPRELLQELRMIPDTAMLRYTSQRQKAQRTSLGASRIGKKGKSARSK